MYIEFFGFEWDRNKALLNREKHGLAFEDAYIVFNSPIISFKDKRKDYDEERYITLGTLLGRIVVVIHTPRDENIRIISMRRANEREKKIYYERLKEIR